MKQNTLIAIVCVFALFTALASAQDEKPVQKEPKTKLEAFEAKTGTVLIKGIQEVGSVVGYVTVLVYCRELTDANTRRKEYGITIAVRGSGKLYSKDTAIIDYDEIDSLLKGIDYIAKVDKSATPLTSFEAVYRTKGDLHVATSNSSKSGTVEAEIKCGYLASDTAFLSLEQLTKFRALIETAKIKLDSVKAQGELDSIRKDK